MLFRSVYVVDGMAVLPRADRHLRRRAPLPNLAPHARVVVDAGIAADVQSEPVDAVRFRSGRVLTGFAPRAANERAGLEQVYDGFSSGRRTATS